MEITSTSRLVNDKDLFSRLKHDKKFLKQQKKLKKATQKYIDSISEEHHHPDSLLELSNVDIDYITSISNRGDGKTYSNFDFFIRILAFDFKLYSIYVSRNHTVRDAYVTTMSEMFEELPYYDSTLFQVNNTRLYTECFYDNELFGIITDLNSVTNLKYKSTFLKKFSIIIYDEFLAIEGDYLPDEYERMRILYSSMDRNNEPIPYIGFPKSVFLGNPENFSSPILTGINIFRHLEKHPLGTVKIYGNTVLQMTLNEKRNEKRNTRAYGSEKASITTGQFIVNNHNIVTDTQLDLFNMDKNMIVIRIENNNYLYVYYYFDKTLNKYRYCLSMLNDFGVDYQYNVQLKDNNFNTIYLKDNFYNERHFNLYLTDTYLFMDNYTKDYILNNFNLASIDIKKCVRYNISNKNKNVKLTPLPKVEDEEVYRLSRVKKNLFKKFYTDEYNLPY